MFESFKNLINGDLEKVDSNKLFILNRWASFNYASSLKCCEIDRYMLGCKNKDILIFLMSKKYDKRITKFLKAEKQDKVLIDYVKKYYGWSSRELSYQLKLINIYDKSFLEILSKKFGWDKKTCIKYNVSWDQPKKEKLKKSEAMIGKSLFDF